MDFGRGGARDGAGRPTGWHLGDTKTIRVPRKIADRLLEIARQLDYVEANLSKTEVIEEKERLSHLRHLLKTHQNVKRSKSHQLAVLANFDHFAACLGHQLHTETEN